MEMETLNPKQKKYLLSTINKISNADCLDRLPCVINIRIDDDFKCFADPESNINKIIKVKLNKWFIRNFGKNSYKSNNELNLGGYEE